MDYSKLNKIANEIKSEKDQDQQRLFEEVARYTKTALKTKVAFFSAAFFFPTLAFIMFPSMRDPNFYLKSEVAKYLQGISILGMVGSGAYGIYHWWRGLRTNAAL